MKILKNSLVLFSIVCAIVVFCVPSKAEAIYIDYGGYMVWAMPCTCTGTYYIAIEDIAMTQMYYPLDYIPGVSWINQDFNFYLAGVYSTGQWMPMAPICQIYVEEECVPMTTFGMFTPYPAQGLGSALIPVI